jgi:DNA-3-methyladenine glycosylase
MFNAVTEPEGRAGAVLVRAIEPAEGVDLMKANRGRGGVDVLTNGPARTCQALGITLEQNDWDLTEGPLGIWRGLSVIDADVVTTPRIGVVGSHKEPYRFLIKGNPYVSRQHTGNSKRRFNS